MSINKSFKFLKYFFRLEDKNLLKNFTKIF